MSPSYAFYVRYFVRYGSEKYTCSSILVIYLDNDYYILFHFFYLGANRPTLCDKKHFSCWDRHTKLSTQCFCHCLRFQLSFGQWLMVFSNHFGFSTFSSFLEVKGRPGCSSTLSLMFFTETLCHLNNGAFERITLVFCSILWKTTNLITELITNKNYWRDQN